MTKSILSMERNPYGKLEEKGKEPDVLHTVPATLRGRRKAREAHI